MKQKYSQICLLALTYLLSTVYSQVSSPETKDFAGRYGVGAGVVWIFIFMLIGMCVCCIGKATAVPMYMAIFGTLLPVIVFAIIYWLPKEADRPSTAETDVDTDWRPLWFILFWILILIFAALALFNLLVIYCCSFQRAYSLDSGSAGITAAFIDNEEVDQEKVYKRDRTRFMTKPQIDAKNYHKVSVRPQNWRNTRGEEGNKDQDSATTGARLQRRRGGRNRKLEPMKERPGITDRIGVSDRKDKQGRVRPILTKDAGTIDARDDYQYGDQDPNGRDLNMNIDVREPGRQGERELDMTDEGVYQRLVRTKDLAPQLPDNFFLD